MSNFQLTSNNDFSYIEIIKRKYIYMNDNILKGLCNKFGIQVFWGAKTNELAKKIIPKFLCSDGFLQEFYHKLQANEKKILKFIVNYNGNDIEKAVKKKFKYEIVLIVKSKIPTYVWWLELFIDNNEFDNYFKDMFLEFLSENRQRKGANKREEKRQIQDDNVVNTTKDIQNVIINKYAMNQQLYSQNLLEVKAEDTILAISVLYALSEASMLKVTQARAISVRSDKLLKSKMPENFDYVWLMNLFTNYGYLTTTQLREPTTEFHTLMSHSESDIIKIVFQEMMQSKHINELKYAMFGVSSVHGDYVKLFRDMILKLMVKEDKSLWINVDYLVNQIKIGSQTLKYITNDYQYAYTFYGNGSRISHNKIEHLKVVVRYFIKTFIGTMSRMGLCDIGVTEYQMYNKQDVRILQNPAGESAKMYAAVEFYKLTSLGAYVLGMQNYFQSKNDYKLVLNSYNYDIKVENPNNLSDIYLEKIATKIDANRYKIDIKTFMKQIDSKIQYQNTKKSFLDKSGKLPSNWEKFFAILDLREESAAVVSKSAVLIKLTNNKEILKLISSNVKLQEKILKADKFHVVVMKDDFVYVQNIFKEYGIII